MSMLLSLGLLGAVVAATVVVALIVSRTSRGRGQVVGLLLLRNSRDR